MALYLLTRHSDLGVSIIDDDGSTALIVASENGHTGIIKLLLECGANVDQKNSSGWTALMKASENSNLEIVEVLLRYGAQVDLRNNGGESALIVAARNCQTELVAKLVRDCGASIEIENNYGETALMVASSVGCTEVAKVLLDQGAEVDKQDIKERTALVIASFYGHYETVKLLLEFGANVNIKASDNHATALTMASRQQHNKIVDLLLEYGAKDDQGIALAHLATSKEVHINIIKLLLEQVAIKADDSRWMQVAVNGASRNGRIDIIKLLLEHGADNLGWALTLAILNKHSDIVELLLKCGAQVDDENWSDINGLNRPPLVEAVKKEDTDMVSLLLKHGARDGLGWAITEAIFNEHTEIIQILSEYGAQADESDRLDRRPSEEPTLVTACKNENITVVKLLLKHGADGHLGWGLTEAIFNRNTEIIQLLSNCGARVDDNFYWYDSPPLVEASMEGKTQTVKLMLAHGAEEYLGWALAMAVKHKHTEVVDLLLEHGTGVDLSVDYLTTIVEAGEDVVKLFLDKGARVDIAEANGSTALIIASKHGHSDVVKLLLDKGAQVDIAETDGWTALIIASQNGHSDVVKLLLDKGAQVDITNTNGSTALIIASGNGHSDVVKLLLDKGAQVDITEANGWTALIIASGNGHSDVVKLLLDKGAQVDITNTNGCTALIKATENGHSDVVKLLLDKGAQVDITEANGSTALIIASGNGHSDVVKLLLDKSAQVDITNTIGSTALTLASENGHSDVVKLLLDKGAQVDITETDGWTALIIASQNGHSDVVKLLLDKGAQVDIAESDGWTALIIASQNGHPDVVKLLLDKGAQVDITESDGWTALIIASQNGHSDVAKLLLKYGANVNQQSSDGSSPLMLACCSGHAKTVETLIEYGAQTDLQNQDGWSPLMKTSQAGRTDIVKLLLEHGAQVNLQSKDGSYALMVASEEGYIEVVKQLLKHGSQVDLKDNHGRTAVTAARNTDILLALFTFNTDLPEVGGFDDIPQSDTQHKSLDENEQKQHLIAIENAIRDRGQLDHTLVHGVFVGPPRSGKDSLMKRLLGEQITNDSPSTGVAENVVHVKVEESSTFAATVDQSNWARLAYDEEAVHLMKTASNKNSNVSHLPKEFSDEKGVAGSTDLVLKEIEKTAQQTQEKSAQNNTTSGEESLTLQFMSPLEEIFQSPEHPELQASRQHKSPMEIFKEALKSKGLEGLKKQLLKSWSLYLTNTGGQMEFQELLPLLVSGPSIFFITFQLHKDLNQHFSVEYELPSGESSKSYQSSLSILESILQTLSSISAMGTYVYKDLQRKVAPLRPKVFIIGTHKDLLNKKTAAIDIKSIDQYLQAVIKPTSHYREGIIQFASESQMIFAVNNHDPNDSDFKRIRTAVEKVVETGDYRMRSPAHWMIYSLVVRQLQNRIESYDECFAIAKECGIRDTNEFNEALHFIHTKMGLIRYFPHEDLKDLIIVDPQILFEKVTELIVETFTFEKHCNFSNVEMFKNMGIFNLSDFTRISSQTGQNLTAPLFAQLLEHLRIAARFQQNGETKYFLPCVLTHAQAKQSDDTSILPPLIVAFQCGYCPKGLFGTLITYLISNEMQSDFEWEFDTEKIYRDEVCFQVGPYDTVTIRFLPTHLEITCVDSNPKVVRINCTKESICQEVFQSVENGIKAVTSAIKYINAQHSFTFYCTSESCSEESHPAKLKKLKGKSCSLRCERLKQCFPLPSGYDKWQLDSSPQISEPAKGTASVPHHIESCTRLEKEHHAQLFEQLSRCAAKWRIIGIYLGFHDDELHIIAAMPSLFHEGTGGYLREMLSNFLEWAPGDQRGSKQYATLEALKTAVDKAGLGATAADLTICVETTDSITSRDHGLSHSATASAIRSGNKRNKECTEESSPKRPRREST